MSDITITVQHDATGTITINGNHQPITAPDVARARQHAMQQATDHARTTGRTTTVTAIDPTGTYHLAIQPDGTIAPQPAPPQAPAAPIINEVPGAQNDTDATRPRTVHAAPPAADAAPATEPEDQDGAVIRENEGEPTPPQPATPAPQPAPEPVQELHTFREVQSDVHSSMTPAQQHEYQNAPDPDAHQPAPQPVPSAHDEVEADPRWAELAQQPATRGFRGTLNGLGMKLAPTDDELAQRRETLRQDIARENQERAAAQQHAQDEAEKETRRAARERETAARDKAERIIIQTNYDEPKTVGVMNDKGGVGKTTDALCIAAAAGRIRGGDVIAWDANETRGTMGFRALKDRHDRSVVDFLEEAAPDFTTVEGSKRTTLTRYTRSQGDNKFSVLASDESRKKQDQVDGDAFRTVHEIVGRFHSLIIVDTGNNHEVSHFKAALAATDQLVVPVSPGEDGAYAAELMLDNFIAWGYGDLVKNAVVLLHDSATQRGDARAIAAKFENRVRTILPIPFDPILDAGGQIDFDALKPTTRAAYQTAAAAISHGLADTKEH